MTATVSVSFSEADDRAVASRPAVSAKDRKADSDTGATKANKLEFGDRVLIADHRRVGEPGPLGVQIKSIEERWRPATVMTWVRPTDTRAEEWIVEFDDNPERLGA